MGRISRPALDRTGGGLSVASAFTLFGGGFEGMRDSRYLGTALKGILRSLSPPALSTDIMIDQVRGAWMFASGLL